MKNLNMKKMKKSGFSMLELVVVMLIMGTLRGIRISKMGGSDTGAIKASMKSDLRGAIAGINACYADKLDYKLCDVDFTDFVESKDNTIVIEDLPSTRKSSTFPKITITNSTLTGFNGFEYDPVNDVNSISEITTTP